MRKLKPITLDDYKEYNNREEEHNSHSWENQSIANIHGKLLCPLSTNNETLFCKTKECVYWSNDDIICKAPLQKK